jgi:CHAT domain-containing protein/tetratricopeptide (TPR) repeat protein
MAAPTDSVAEQASGLPLESPGDASQLSPLLPTEEVSAAHAAEALRSVVEPGGGAVVAAWTAGHAASVVAVLKDAADRHWLSNPNESLRLADGILRIAEMRDDPLVAALGMMARADALKYLGHAREAWDSFQRAGDAYKAARDEVGWARTRIGMLVMSTSVDAVETALAEAERARAIFQRRGELDLLARLDINLALVYSWIGDPRRSLSHNAEALRRAEEPGSRSRQFLGLIYTNCGSVHANLLGNYRAALGYFEKARAFAEERHDIRNVALAELDIAYVATQQGRYREALVLLRRARAIYEEQQLALDVTHVDREIVECYIQLRRFEEARDLARDVVDRYKRCGDDYNHAHALLNLATASVELGELAGVPQLLDSAELLFRALRAPAWAAVARLRRARLALHGGAAETACREAASAAEDFAAAGLPMQGAYADVVRAESLLLLDRPEEAAAAAGAALVVARAGGASLLRYTAHLALGRVAERDRSHVRADREYRAAIAAVDRMQRDLTITLRPGFLEDKGEALRALMDLRLGSGDAAGAFTALEHAKSQAHAEYAANREQLHWAGSAPESRALFDELDALRDRHRWLFRLVHGELDGRDANPKPAVLPIEDAAEQLAANERRMRALTEQLYLNVGGARPRRRTATPTLLDVQAALEGDSALLEYYSDGSTLYGFVIDKQSIQFATSPVPVQTIERLSAQLQLNVATTLRHDPHSPALRVLRGSALRLLEQLDAALLDPFRGGLAGRRLYIVPFGVLHYLPFHLLRRGGHYLIEDHEVVMLPSAGLLSREVPARPEGARIVAHSAGGSLPQVLVEARMVGEFFKSETRIEHAANRGAFEAAPSQVLHVAAHAAYRLDQPDFSYIELADGQLYADDLMQHDLSYELVTLSACETGRAHIAARDELIGLGRGFLYAGAGALVVSLWRVCDEIALPLMRHLYAALCAGASKARALQAAQVAMLAADPELHPALWGPFQLIGDARPLSGRSEMPAAPAD